MKASSVIVIDEVYLFEVVLMQIALIGDLEKIGKLVNIIASNWDNAQVTLFPSVTDFQCKAIMRTIYVDRIIILDNTNIAGQDALYTKMGVFKQFLEEDTTYGVTTIVVLCKNTSIADIYANFFNDKRSLVLTFTSTLKSIDVRNFAGEPIDVLRGFYKDSITSGTILPEVKEQPMVEKRGLFGANKKQSEQDNLNNAFTAMDATAGGATFADDITQSDFMVQGFYPQYNANGIFGANNVTTDSEKGVSAVQILDSIFDAPADDIKLGDLQPVYEDYNDEEDSGDEVDISTDDSTAFTEISFDSLFDDTDNVENEEENKVDFKNDGETSMGNEDSDDIEGESAAIVEGQFDLKNSGLYEGVEQRINSMSEDEMAALFDD